MKKLFKILFGLVLGLVLLMVLAGFLLPYFYDKEDLKKAISTEVATRTSRELSIEGDLDFSVFPWLAVEVGDLSLGNAPGFGDQPLARVDNARVGVALMPLFRRQIVVDEVTLDGLQLSLEVNEKGQNNWDDLSSGTAPAPDAESGPAMFSSQKVAGLDIRNANVEYRDRQSGSHHRLSGLTVSTGALGDSKPVPLELKALLEDITAKTSMNVELATVAAINLEAEQYAFEDFEFALVIETNGQQQSVDIQAPQLIMDLSAQTLELPGYSIELSELTATGALSAEKISTDFVFTGSLNVAEFSPARLMQTLNMEVPATTDPQVFQSAAFSADLSGSSSQLVMDNFQLVFDQSRITGDVNVQNFDQPIVGFTLAVDEINLDRYLEPVAEDDAATAEDVAIPQDELQGHEVQGQLSIGALTLAGLDFTDAVLGLSIRNGRLRLHPLTAGFYGGRYSGDVGLDGSGAVPVISLDEKIESITFQRLVSDLVESESLSGEALGHVRMTGRGKSSSEVLGSLQGDLGLTLTEGALEGINIWYEIRRGLALYKGQPAPDPEPKRTVFSRMQVAGNVQNGVFSTRTLTGELPFLTVRGNGEIDLGQSQYDLGLVAEVRDAPELEDDPLASGLSGRSLPFKISGPLDAPSLSVDWAALLKGEATNLLLKKLGVTADESQEGVTEEEPEDDSSNDQLEEAAKGLISGFLNKKSKDKEENKDEEDGQQ